jgi:hypothetical protein
MYLAKRYDESLEEFTNALLVAPEDWAEKPKLYCNRAAAYIMMHRCGGGPGRGRPWCRARAAMWE